MEKIFFEYDDVKVTNTRFINGARTYTMSGITSIKRLKKEPNMMDVNICLVIIFILIFFNPFGPGISYSNIYFIIDGLSNSLTDPRVMIPSCFLAGLAYYLYKKKKTVYAIIIGTSGSETETLLSNHLEYSTQVANALNEAVIYRG